MENYIPFCKTYSFHETVKRRKKLYNWITYIVQQKNSVRFFCKISCNLRDSQVSAFINQIRRIHLICVLVEVPQAVRDELAMSELRNKRLKEVFSKKIQEFRQVSLLLCETKRYICNYDG